MNSRPAEILLIRHGETASNAARIIQLPETPLSGRGQEQAQLLAQRLADAPIRQILSSDFARAAMTARALERSTAAPIDFEPLLQERNFGALRGTPYAELECDPFAPGYAPPAGETWPIFHARVERAWRRVVERAHSLEGQLAVVTHGLVCHSIATQLVRVSPAEGDAGVSGFGNTSITQLRGPDPWHIVRLACTAHLDAASDPAAKGGGAV